ncbi:hypothetical protein HHK36_008998 [Tetracentron sinense]|uniref:Protein RETICULATA-RELATED 1, chloroplastic n=1 Tax=Tetracentron sinense TaxID=13715 RepID=A0A835DH19_TETSI|nr:hypothetical protein HHK36_008998 [Tetracentron sinense]
MSHAVFQTAQNMPINTQIPNKILLPHPSLLFPLPIPCRSSLVMKASYAFVGGDPLLSAETHIALLECSFRASPNTDTGGIHTFGIPQTAIGGGGGDIGKKNSHGGGDGGDDGGDDDDYFDDFDEGDEGDEGGLFRRRLVLQEGLVSSAQMVRFLAINARPTTARFISRALPQGISRAFIGRVSKGATILSVTAALVAMCSSLALVQAIGRGRSSMVLAGLRGSTPYAPLIVLRQLGYQQFVPTRDRSRRMIADPAFLYKLLLEQATTIGCSVWWELKNRKERIKQEWDLALINVLTVSACNAVVVWSLAPCRSYGNTFQFDLQNTLQKLPSNIFERSYPLREFDLQKRIHSFFYKAAELCMVGFTAGAAQGALSKLSSSKKEGRLSVMIPTVSTNALGYGAFLGLYANLRYQLLCGIDRAMINHFDVIGVALCFSTALRILNVQLGETSRLAWLGVEADPLVQSDNLLKAYNRPSEVVTRPSSNWIISKNAIVSGLGLLGIKQGNSDPTSEGEAAPPKVRRKRIIRKKVSTNST